MLASENSQRKLGNPQTPHTMILLWRKLINYLGGNDNGI
jgi:hypothetical protein